MTLLYSDPRFLNHETGNHPERADRIRAIPQRLEASGLDGRCRRVDFEPVSRERLARVHSPTHIDQVLAMAKWGGGHLDPDTVVCAASYEVALLAAGCVCDAVERVVRGEDTTALCLVRPPGHHAMANRAMGFCLFNNVAVAARLAVDELGLDRVLVVDWDVHHGNGTQTAFWEDPAVGYLSIHRWPFYPGTGRDSETGSGPALGTVRNLPVEFGISRKDYLALFSDELERFAAQIKPQLILISAGFDAHALDPIGGLGLETEDFGAMSEIVLDMAGAYADGRLVSVLEGGYHPTTLADSIELHLTKLVRRGCKDKS